MPVIYKCSACGFVLYSFEKVGQDFYGLPTPSELATKLGGRCSKCGNSLGIPKLGNIKLIK
ncbi:MAG: hypothetical protein RMH77_01165 [Sulfolobales archaeon]|nr:hypothetical protein [Sulfolobales archaeon]MCX8186263.1 hypothetical protein [Sulfolobales archaeon]MDW7969001.1 hypothetical protein [Sulfolobales archaeon]